MATRAEVVDLTPTETLSSAGTSQSNPITSQDYDNISVTVSVTAITGTTPSVTPKLQCSDDGTNWIDIATGTAITATGTQRLVAGPNTTNNVPIGQLVRMFYTVAGTTPSITLTANAVLKG